MGLLNHINFGLTLLIGAGVYAGLDKLVSIFLLLTVFVFSQLFNYAVAAIERPESRLLKTLLRPETEDSNRKRKRLLRTLISAGGFFAAGLVLYQLYLLSLGFNLSVYESLSRQAVYIFLSIFLIFYAVFAMRTLQEDNADSVYIKWFRALCYFAVYHLGVFLLSFLSSFISEAEGQLLVSLVDFGFFVGFFVMSLLVAELMVCFIRSFFAAARCRNEDETIPLPFFISFFAAEDSLKISLVRSLEKVSGVDVSRSEIIGFCLHIAEPVCIFAVIIIWLLTSLVIVGPDKEAIFVRFGHIVESRAFGPGLYFKLPWPFTSAQLFDSFKIRTLNIGFEPDPKQRHIIWTKSHAVKAFDLIVGDGVEIIAIDCQIMFRIKNLYQYVINLQNTEEFISAATYKLLTQETVCSRFDDIIARDRRVLADLLKEKLQRLVDEEKLGVSIVEVVFLAMHPPLDVADAFEDVISAQIDKLTYELKANTENSYKLSMNQALARGKELEAESYAINQTARAIGDASAFASRTLGYQIDPELTKFRLRYERLQQVLSGKTLYVMDKSLMRKEDRIYLDIKDQEGN